MNLEFLIKETDGNIDVFTVIIKSFREQLFEYQSNMEVALEGKDLESIHQYAHKIKSSIQIFGLKEFCSIHKDIFEFSSEKKNIENIRTLFEIQQKQIPGIIEQLDTIIAHHNE